MIVEAIDRIIDLAPPSLETIGGLEYTDKVLTLVKPPTLPRIAVSTLTALVTLYTSDFENIIASHPVFHVTSETTVDVIGKFSDLCAQRTYFAEGVFKTVKGFKFNDWLPQEEFIIGLQANMIDSYDREYLLKATASITADASLQIEDNGVAQLTTVKAGTSLSSTVTLKPRVTLQPYRTFREVNQPASDFVFRVRKGQAGPVLALFEADGGAWKIEAMSNIYKYLRGNLVTGYEDQLEGSLIPPQPITTATVVY